MPAKKAVTTADIKVDEGEAKADKSVKLTSPTGHVTEVPAGIVDVLIESGYKRK